MVALTTSLENIDEQLTSQVEDINKHAAPLSRKLLIRHISSPPPPPDTTLSATHSEHQPNTTILSNFYNANTTNPSSFYHQLLFSQ